MLIMMIIKLELFHQTVNIFVSLITEDLYSHKQDGKCGLDGGSFGLNVLLL